MRDVECGEGCNEGLPRKGDEGFLVRIKNFEQSMEQFLVAADVLVGAYGDLKILGRFSQPGVAAAAYADMKRLMGYLTRAELDTVPYSGTDVLELVRLSKEFHEHTCSCFLCFGYEEVGSDQERTEGKNET